jgi:hypothetical protein
MTMPAPAHISPDHDETLIARLAATDLTDRESADARSLVASCPACAELHADLRSIMAATASLPAPRRTRDFRLTEADAARLQRTGWRRLLARFGEPRLAFTKPLATGLVTLGIAGLLFAVAPSFLATAGLSATSATAATAGPAFAPAPGGAGSVAGPSEQVLKQDAAASAAASPAASAASSAESPPVPSTAAASIPVSAPTQQVPTASSAAPSGAPTALGLGPESAVPSPGAPADGNFSANRLASGAAPPSSGPSPLFVASVVLLVLGIGLFLLRWAARRPA